jgi:molybdate transport system substrate-binding protein
MLYRSLCCFAATGLFIVAQTALTAAADLKVLTTPALTEVWHELAPKFEATGHKLIIVYAASGAIAKRVTDGEAADLLVSTPGRDRRPDQGRQSGRTGPTRRSRAPVWCRGAQRRAEARHLDAGSVPSRPARRQGGRLYGPGERRRERRPHGQGVGAARHRRRGEREAKLERGIPVATFVVKGEADLAIQQMPELLGVVGVPAICRT